MSINRCPTTIQELPRHIALFPLHGTILLPRGDLTLNVFEPRYISLVDDALADNRLIGVIQPMKETGKNSLHPLLAPVGCLGRITAFHELPEGKYAITVTGICRFRNAGELETQTLYRKLEPLWDEFAADLIPNSQTSTINRDLVFTTLRSFLKTFEMEADWEEIYKAPDEALINALAMISPYGMKEKQALLEAPDLKNRSEMLIAITEMLLSRHDNAGKTLQ